MINYCSLAYSDFAVICEEKLSGKAREVQAEIRGIGEQGSWRCRLPLPLVEVWEELQPQVEHLSWAGRAADHPGE